MTPRYAKILLPATTQTTMRARQRVSPLSRPRTLCRRHLPHAAPQVDKAKALEMFRAMLRVNVVDSILFEAQRQGRGCVHPPLRAPPTPPTDLPPPPSLSFYMQNTGEEATQIGSAAALTADDVIFAQVRRPASTYPSVSDLLVDLLVRTSPLMTYFTPTCTIPHTRTPLHNIDWSPARSPACSSEILESR